MSPGKSLKVLLILETSDGGSGRHVLDLARELIRLGCSVSVIYSGLRASAWFTEELGSIDGLEPIRIDMRRTPCPGDVIAGLKIRKALSRYGPFDVIHGHSSKGGALARLAALGRAGVRLYTPHAFRTLDPSLGAGSYRLYAIVEQFLSKISSGIILVSEAERNHALQIGLPAEVLHVIPNGMVALETDSREAIRARVGLAPDALCIGFVGRMVPQKAPERVVRSFARIADKYPDTRLVMLGGGPLKSETRRLAEQLELNHQIAWIEGENGAQFMPALDVFVMPSLYEAFPYVLLEAANASLPIIATPVGGTDEMVHAGVNGFIIEHDEPGAFADCLEQLITDPALRSEMGAASRKLGLKYSVAAMAEKTLQLYRSLLGGIQS